MPKVVKLPTSAEAPVIQTGNCWFFHKWEKWQDVSQRYDPYSRLEVTQKRRCKRCGKVEAKRTTAE